MQPVDPHEEIEVLGARQHNLQDVSLRIPKRRLTVVTGVSGSGKSSLVFGTIAAESQRLINETYSAFVQGFMPTRARPDVDRLRGLSAAIVVDQERMGANSRSTLGTATDAFTMLRMIFSRVGRPHLGPASAFSFNEPTTARGGRCRECEGVGRVTSLDLDAVVDQDRSLNEGAVLAPNFQVGGWYWQIMAGSGFFDPDTPVRDLTDQEREDFFHRPPTKVRIDNHGSTYEGLVPRIRRLYLDPAKPPRQAHVRAFVEQVATSATCPVCRGTRLNPEVLTSTVHGQHIAGCNAMQVSDLLAWLDRVDEPGVEPVVASLRATLQALVSIGLGYLSLDRESGTLSGGEAQRVKLVRHLGSALSDVTYAFDEPTAGLHPHDVERMVEVLTQLRDGCNTVLVVEHKPSVIRAADHIVDLGPGAGADGGRIIYAGDVVGLATAGTPTARSLTHRVPLRAAPRAPTGQIHIEGADLHNLRNVTVDIPEGVLTVVTGVAGSGKSSLVHGSLAGRPGVIVADQSPVRGSRRSSPATYTGLLDHIRSAFAKTNGVQSSLFSANSAGACPTCKGLGVTYTDLAFMAGVTAVCEECDGRRYTDEVLTYRLHGQSIADVLSMSVGTAHAFFGRGAAHAILTRLVDVGLGYLALGQPLSTLSGGERQRLKLAVHLAGDRATYVLDEPTGGLHAADVDRLLGLLDRLVDDGGEVVFTGTPADLVARGDSLTARHLAAYTTGA